MADTKQTTTQPATQPATRDRIRLTVRNRKQVIFDEDVRSVTSRNDTGVFDVLPEHANFISLINDSLTIRKLDRDKQVIPLASGGVIKVKDNTIHCYVDLLSTEEEEGVKQQTNRPAP